MFELVDTTLRDGEQTAGVVFGAEEKVEMVRLLNRIGIHWIEAGIPAMGAEEQVILKEMLKANRSAGMIAWNRADIGDVEKSIVCGFEYIHISLPVSDFHINYKLKKSREWVLSRLKEILKYTKSAGAKVLVGAEDASRSDNEFFLRYADTAAEGGAIRIRYADTIGCMEPFKVAETFQALVMRCPLPIEFHGHNDFGLAVANSVAAYQSGVPYVSVTSTGIGERAGNSCLEDFAGAMSAICRCPLHLNLAYLPRLTEIVRNAKMRKKHVEGGDQMITKDMRIGSVMVNYPETLEVLADYELDCRNCMKAKYETLEQAAQMHGFPLEQMLYELNDVISHGAEDAL